MTSPVNLGGAPQGPLRGVRILDLTSVVFGAYATQMLGDLGADVLKVEPPPSGRDRGGDILRWAGSPPEGAPEGLGPLFMTVNRNKRSLALDLARPEDHARLLELVTECDVFAASVRYEGLKRLGLDYETLGAIRPGLVYVHGAGYGSGGPYAGEPAYDDLIQSAAGLADLLPRTDGDPTPRLLPALVADKVAGLFMTQAVLAALLHRERTGEGQFVEVPMFECLTSFNLAEHLFGRVFDPPTGPFGYTRVVNPNRQPYPTRDGWMGLLPYTDRNWRDFFALVGWSETIGQDPRFATATDRARNAEVLYGLVREVTPTRTTDEWIASLQPLGIPVVRTNRLDDLLEDPHLKAVGFFDTLVHPEAGAYRAMRPPLGFSRTPADIRRHPPALGANQGEGFELRETSRSAETAAPLKDT